MPASAVLVVPATENGRNADARLNSAESVVGVSHLSTWPISSHASALSRYPRFLPMIPSVSRWRIMFVLEKP